MSELQLTRRTFLAVERCLSENVGRGLGRLAHQSFHAGQLPGSGSRDDRGSAGGRAGSQQQGGRKREKSRFSVCENHGEDLGHVASRWNHLVDDALWPLARGNASAPDLKFVTFSGRL